jgi:hypothetical protein
MNEDLRKRVVLLSVLLLVAAGGYALWPSEARRVEKCVRGAAAAFEREDLLGLAGYVARDYADQQGLGYEEVLAAAKGQFDRYDDMKVDFSGVDVDLKGARAQVAARASVRGRPARGGDAGGIFGDGDVLDLRIGLRKGSDGWRIASVEIDGE